MSGGGRTHIKRPDVNIRDKKLEPLEIQLKKIDQGLDSIQKQIDRFKLPEAHRENKQKLHEQLKGIIKTQSELKGKRQQIHDKIKQLDAQVKRKTNEIGEKLGSGMGGGSLDKKLSGYRSVEEIKSRLDQIDEEMSSGNLSIVDEKMRVKEMQSLHKLSKDLQLIEPIKKSIEEDKAKIVMLKQQLTELNPKEVSSQFESTQAQLNELQSKYQNVNDERTKLRAKKSALYTKKDEVMTQIRKIRSDFDNEFKAYKKKLEEEGIRREEEMKLSRLLEEKEDQVSKLQEKLIHARRPAFANEISSIEVALFSLDPTFVKPASNKIQFPGELATDDSSASKKSANGSEELVTIKKPKDDYIFGTVNSNSKSKKNKKKSEKFILESNLITILANLDVTVPLTKDQVPATLEELKKKYQDYLERQEEQTEKNIAQAQEQLDKLELEYKQKEEQVKKELEQKRALEAAKTAEAAA